jgi:hypothetical protein
MCSCQSRTPNGIDGSPKPGWLNWLASRHGHAGFAQPRDRDQERRRPGASVAGAPRCLLAARLAGIVVLDRILGRGWPHQWQLSNPDAEDRPGGRPAPVSRVPRLWPPSPRIPESSKWADRVSVIAPARRRPGDPWCRPQEELSIEDERDGCTPTPLLVGRFRWRRIYCHLASRGPHHSGCWCF